MYFLCFTVAYFKNDPMVDCDEDLRDFWKYTCLLMVSRLFHLILCCLKPSLSNDLKLIHDVMFFWGVRIGANILIHGTCSNSPLFPYVRLLAIPQCVYFAIWAACWTCTCFLACLLILFALIRKCLGWGPPMEEGESLED